MATPPGSRYSIRADGSLQISPILPSDRGTFNCSVSNKAGQEEANISVSFEGGWSCCGWSYIQLLRVTLKDVVGPSCNNVCVGLISLMLRQCLRAVKPQDVSLLTKLFCGVWLWVELPHVGEQSPLMSIC